MIDVSQSTEYFLIISAKPELKLGQRLVNGRIVNVRLRNSAEILVDWPFKKAIVDLSIWPGLLKAWLVLTSVKYHGNLYILIPLNQRLALTRLRATGPRMKQDLKRTTGNSLSPLVTQNKDIGAALQTLLTEVKLRL